MASSARIEELERKFNENPRRYFAPLANEYRKAGDLEQAIAICRTYVPQQPAHMSGHIVFGQALFEAGEHEEARGVFEAALALDPENLIALRHLGDIARERGEAAAARTWYQRVLDADPRNDEVAALLAAVDGPAVRSGATTVPTWAEVNPERTLELPPGLLEAVGRDAMLGGGPPAARDVLPAAPAVAPVAFEQTLQPPPPATLGTDSPAVPPVSEDEIPEPGFLDVEQLDTAPLTAEASASHGEAPAPAEAPRWADEPTSFDATAVPLERAEHPGDAATGIGETTEHPEAIGGLEPMEFVAPPQHHIPAGGASMLAELGFVEGVGPEEETPAVFVTETMAELYLQQGFREEALSVYRQLLAQSPGDAALRERVAVLEGERTSGGERPAAGDAALPQGYEGPPTIRAFFADLASRRWQGGHPIGPPPGPAGRHGHAPDTLGAVPGGAGDALAAEEASAADESWRSVASVADAEPSQPPTHTVDSETPSFATAISGGGAVPGEGATTPSPSHSARNDGPTPDASALDASALDASALDASALDASAHAAPTAIAELSASEFDVASYDAIDMSAVGESTTPSPGDTNGAAPAAVRKPMQTGSVNVLFPQQSVQPADETAAATLSDAFGGPTQPGAAAAGHAARPASNELSLDSIFREAGPPAEPRREASAFSFDQFFTESAGSPAAAAGTGDSGPVAPSDGLPGDSADAMTNDAEQFSNWLAGLKKK